MGFDDILGHARARALLRSAIQQDRVHHAWLLVGPRGVGARTLALTFAQALNCLDPGARSRGDACGHCSACSRLHANAHPDLRILGADREQAQIKVDDVRELTQRYLSLRVFEARTRAVLVLDAERMNASTANALLKTLEEPPRQTVFLLTARNLNALLPTIRSRCQKLRLSPLEPDLLAEYLVGRLGIPSEQAVLLARLSEGSLGQALNLTPEQLSSRTDLFSRLLSLGQSRATNPVALAEAIAPDRSSLLLQLGFLESLFRDIAMRTADVSVPLRNPDFAPEIGRLAAKLSPAGALALLKSVDESRVALRLNISPPTTLEHILLSMARVLRAHT